MSDDETSNAANSTLLYGADYYASHCGPVAYDRSRPEWTAFFGSIAEELIRTFRPHRVFDAGCAHGFLVESLWDRGVEAWGRDISDYAISKVRPDIQPFCAVGSLADPIEGSFDLAVSIEVLEHMSEADGMRAIANLASVTDRIVFSSSPSDFDEPTHINVKPPLYWMQAFAQHNFAPAIAISLPSITAHTIVFTKGTGRPSDDFLSACSEIIRCRIRRDQDASKIAELSAKAADRDLALAKLDDLRLELCGDSSIFDPVYYVKAYPDVQAADHEALGHYVNHGRFEGRFPNAIVASNVEKMVADYAKASS